MILKIENLTASRHSIKKINNEKKVDKKVKQTKNAF